MKLILFLISLFSLVLQSAYPGLAADRATILARTFYPLEVYFLQGRESGPTIMVQGGIQGDELAGIIAAQILTKSLVKKGNLIIIPRANLPSIYALKRQINVDLNRRFDRDYNQYYEDYLARAIKYMVSKSDGLIHLHEGSGFYSPRYIDSLRNPRHFGQSIIIDAHIFEDRIYLANLALGALGRINGSLRPARYSFQLFNMNTFAPGSLYPEQRKSLTYYTLGKLKIPAMAVEVSKNIRDLSWKVNCHCRIVKELLSQMGVEIELPANITKLAKEWFDDPIKIKINGQDVAKTSYITLTPYAELNIQLDSNAYATCAADQTGKSWAVTLPHLPYLNLINTKIVCLKPFPYLDIILDGKKIKRIKIKWKETWFKKSPELPILVYSQDRKVKLARPGAQISAYEGQTIFLHGLWLEHGQEVLNVKGFVSNKISNDGQDKGIPIVLAKDGFMPRYIQESGSSGSEGQEWSFDIQRETERKKRYQWKVRVKKAKFSGLRLQGPIRSIRPARGAGSNSAKSAGERQQHFLFPGNKEYFLEKGKYILKSFGPEEDFMCFVNDYPLPIYPNEQLNFLRSGRYILHIFEGRSFANLRQITVNIQ
ncbi:M99 family carboxypeptidase catalytic domain-containing protein [Desulfovulcanus sp.]